MARLERAISLVVMSRQMECQAQAMTDGSGVRVSNLLVIGFLQ
jgi:hypothetical protein